jgi:hypothetical protein
MATQSEINASLGLPPGINPDGSWNAQDYMARRVAGQVDTQAQVDAARAANPYSAQNMAKVDVTRPGQYVEDAAGNAVALTPGVAGYDATNPTALTYLGELRARGGNDTTSQAFNATATPAQKAEADRLWSIEKARLEEIDRQAALAAQPTGLLTGQPVQGASDTTKQAMENLSTKKSYTDAEVKQALKDLSYLDPKASIKDIITAAQTYGIDRDRVVKNISSFTYTAENVDKLSKQILAQNTTATWKGDVKPETAAKYMADDLAKSGITDISQVGKGITGIINKETGEKLISGYGERTKGNLWSGSYEGAGNTGFGVQFTDSGAPMFYTEGASSSTLKKDLLKAAVIAAAVMGVVGPESLSGIFGSGAMVGEGLTAAEALAAGLTPAQAAAAGLTAAELTAAGYTAAELTTAGLTTAGATTAGATTAGATTAGATTAGATTTSGLLTGATTLTASELATAARLGLTATQFANLLTSGGQTVAGLLQQETSREAAVKAQAMIDTETAAAKQAAAFRPVGMTTRFGTSEFKLDPKTGQLISAGYTATPGVLEAQNRLVALGNQGLAQAEGAQAQFAPLQAGATSLFNLGSKYLAQSPEAVAENYLKSQMSLLQPGRELELANLQNKLQQQGRGGLAVAQGGTLGDTTPELQALFNARATQEAQLAANAQQYGQQQVGFGAGLLSQGAQTMGQYYGGQQAAYAPYTTALGQFQNLEQLAQQPLSISAGLAQQSATAGANVGRLGLLGAGASVDLATGRAATTNPYATALGGLTSNPLLTDALARSLGYSNQAGSLTAGLTPAQIQAAELGFPTDFSFVP